MLRRRQALARLEGDRLGETPYRWTGQVLRSVIDREPRPRG